MSYSAKLPMKTLMMVVATATLIPIAWAQAQSEGPADVEEMRREIRQLRSQVQALRSAMSEAAELDRQRAAALGKALKAVPAESPAPASNGRETAEPARPAPTRSGPAASAPSLGTARVRVTPEPGAVVRGKVDVPSGEPVAYVYVENVFAPAVKGQKVVIEQVGKKFVPSWAVIQRGTVVDFPNMDNIYHNVFSLSSGNAFDLGLYNSGGETKSHKFNEPGAVEIYCNIHPQMAASALVVPNRHYAKVKSDGTFEISGVPRGKRKVVAWAPGSRLTAQWVELAGSAAEVSLKLEPKSSGHKNKSGTHYGSYE